MRIHVDRISVLQKVDLDVFRQLLVGLEKLVCRVIVGDVVCPVCFLVAAENNNANEDEGRSFSVQLIAWFSPRLPLTLRSAVRQHSDTSDQVPSRPVEFPRSRPCKCEETSNRCYRYGEKQ